MNEKKLRIKLCLTIFSFVMLSFVCFPLAEHFFMKNQNPITIWLNARLDIVYILILLVGLFSIFYYYWGKPWTYLSEIISATQTVYEQNDQAIELSEPLHDVENKMNQIKMSMLLNQKAAKEAEARNQELVMYLAHDIRTPLTTVIGYLSLLQEAPDMPQEQKAKYIGIALEKAERLEDLLNELFEITRYNMQTVTLKKSNFNLHTLLTQIVDEFYPTLIEHSNSIDFSVEKDLMLNADPEKLARVFNNLLKNAVAYSFPNTPISISAQKLGNNISVTFQNQGHTIPENQINNIFEKFSRLDESRMSNTGGTGLGLSIAKEIILLHGGEIAAQSENETITFTIQLPVSS